MSILKRTKKRGATAVDSKSRTALAYYLTDCPPLGYHRLIDDPQIGSCVNRIASIAAGATIYLRRNTKDGDKRVINRLSRFVDIDPWPSMGTRASWVDWIVSTMLTVGDGNALVLPHFDSAELSGLEPMPGAITVPDNTAGYKVRWRGRTYDPDEVLHFRLHADLDDPWKGRGIKIQAENIAKSLAETEALKSSLSSPEYKPPLIVMVNSDSDLADEEKRNELRDAYLPATESGKPWILPAELMQVTQVKPLTLTDLAIKDTIELDKKTAASITGVPGFMLGLGAFNETEFNNFVRTVIIPICVAIEQELTLKLLISPELYFKFNRKHLYAWDMMRLVTMDLSMADRGYMNGDEVRADAFLDPAGLTEYSVLENYIPIDQIGDQAKLNQNTS